MKNYIKTLTEKADERFSEDSLNMPMTEWIAKNTKIKGREFSLKGYEFQKAILDDMHHNMDVIKPSQVGLALDLETPLLTTEGWKTMGTITVGDIVYDEQGRETTVLSTSEIYKDHDCYEIEFDDGQKIVADANHRWYVECAKAFDGEKGLYTKSGRIPKNSTYAKTGVIRTHILAGNFKDKHRNLFSIPNTQPLSGEDKDIAVDPYYLGFWLGDGSSSSTHITADIDDLYEVKEKLESSGLVVMLLRYENRCPQIKVDLPDSKRFESMQYLLTCLGVRDKHIPENYLSASKETRLSVLQGLMDSDGSVTKRGRCSFYNTNPRLVSGFTRLAHSLGIKTRTRWKHPYKSVLKCGHVINSTKKVAEVSFVAYSDQKVFRLKRKLNRLPNRTNSKPSETSRRYVVNVTKVEKRPVRCISVDSPSHLFLCGEALIPTHNTEAQIRKALGFLVRNQGTSLIFSLPTEDMYKRVSKGRVKPIVDSDKVFNTPYDKENKAVRSVDMMQFGQSFLYLTPAIESAATSINADVVMNDEVDLSDQKMITLFNSRLQGSTIALSQRFSTPTFPSFGIDLNYQASDQHEYGCLCESCKTWNFPEFTPKYIHIPNLPDSISELKDLRIEHQDTISLENSYVKCHKCHKPLDLSNPELREWVAKFPSRSPRARGYKVTPFVTARLDPEYMITALWRYQKTEFLRGFHNTVLGLPYSDGSIQLPVEAIQACMPDNGYEDIPIADFDDVWVGIDMGQICHITLAKGKSENDLHYFDFIVVHVDNLIDKVKEICDKYPVRGGSVDRHPYEPTSRDVFHASKGKILPVEYRGTKELNLIENEYKEVTHGQVHRTHFLDRLAIGIRKKKISMSNYGDKKDSIISHLRDMVRDEQPGEPAEWKKLTGNDHWFHSMAFCALAPKIAEILKLSKKHDTRLMTGSQSIIVPDRGANLIGVTPQKTSFITTRVL